MGDAGELADSSVADAMADMEDLDLGDSDEDVASEAAAAAAAEAEAEDEDDLLAGLDDLEGMSDFSDTSQDEDEDDPPQVDEQQDTFSDSPSLVERMKVANAATAAAAEQSAERRERDLEREQKEDERSDGLDPVGGLDDVGDGGDDDVAQTYPQASTSVAVLGSMASDRVSGSGVPESTDLDGLRGAGLVGRRGNRFGQSSARSVQELLVVDPNERSEEEVDILHEWSRSIKGR